jgi:Fe-S oxidoreductase
MAERGQAEFLLWVGCAGSFDEQGTQIASAMVSLLRTAGLDFAILGTEEKCCGDSARRLGQEYLFQTLAGENLSLFLKYKVKKIITFCPHGFNVFRNEYPKLLDLLTDLSADDRKELAQIEVIPHIILLDRLLKDGRLRLKPSEVASLTYHDSCYYGRHNGIIAPPRELLSRLRPRRFVELKNNRRHSFCCGAGGGLMWTEEKLGRRINHLRTDEVIASGAKLAATSCPFCLNMLKDGLKDKEKTEVQVKDIAQLLAERLST